VLGVLSACVLCVVGRSRQLVLKMGRPFRGRHIEILCPVVCKIVLPCDDVISFEDFLLCLRGY
jgi:hypothetical protein